MKTNKLDNSIKEKLQDRTFQSSASAWERLSNQLDEQPKQKKRGWFFYMGAAASILLLVAIGIQFLSSEKKEIKPNVIIVDTPIDTNIIDEKIEQFINEIPVEEALVKNEKVEEKQKVNYNKNVIANKVKQSQINKEITSSKTALNDIRIAKVEIPQKIHPTKERSIKKETLKQNPNSRIKINSEDLLYAVTHSSKEVKAYYAKHDLTREDILKSIKSELKKSNIKVNPNAILAEVERTIGEEDFQNNFMKSIKRRVSDIATALASRND
ncbi:MAG: hypothetical protein ABJH82_06480 [Polaribacter sp.]|uniref:hypothetical protein n=1 Tax=Polaribacter sp. TaxID=1920175 RepID=UPI003265BC2E